MIKNKNKNKDPRQNLRRQNGHWGRFLYRLIFVIFLAVVFQVLFLSGKISVTEIKVTGTNAINPEDIETRVNDILFGQYLKYISKKNLILIMPGQIENDLRQQFKMIRSVEIKKKFPSILMIDVYERQLLMNYCNNETCFSLDEDGAAFEKISLEQSEQMDIPSLRDNNNEIAEEGGTILDQSYVEYVSQIAMELKMMTDIDLEKQYETPSLVSGDIRIKTKEGWQILFNQAISLKKETEMLKLVLEKKIGQDRNNLEYVDLRSANKVFYRLKDGVQQEENREDEQKLDDTKKKEEKKKKK